ncbi:alpha/beta fold hydrolase [Bacillus alkalicellulosilyticus]|uniref:alpha/beta fold hydrolase n=1 Tax=Alkalihalobacterium alkalicellulosilyticum TaxID=1912214 RepID=UPI00099855D5|nr:alpha/beta hydrolase [Bacillus alkalicellulosilyticus]
MFFTKKKDFAIPETGISKVERVPIGGIEQTILLQGESLDLPVLLFLHGGPSLPTPGVSSKGQDYTIVTNTKELVKHFIVVFWDQRGTGKSYHKHISQDSMNLEQFISDAKELTEYLCDRFQQSKLFLVGHSWGSVIGLHLANRFPEKYHSYIGVSQIVNWAENDKLCMEWAKEEARKRNHKQALKELEAVGEPPFTESFQQWGVLRKWQGSFKSMVYKDENTKAPSIAKVALHMLRSEEYSFIDMYNTFAKGFPLVYHLTMIEDFATVHFQQTAPQLKLPVTFIHGEKDVHVFGSLVEDYFNRVDALKGKRLLWLPVSSHVFHEDDTKKIEQYLIEELKHSKAEEYSA